MTKFVVTAGHSNTDPGAVAAWAKEADIAVEMRNIITSKLRALGHTVYTDGDGSTNLPLKEAIALIGKAGTAVEIHCNAAVSASASGVEVIALPKNKKLAQDIAVAISNVTKDKLRGDGGWIDQSKSARGKLGFVDKGGLIIELFFLSNKQSYETFNSVKWVVASAIVSALCK